MNRPFPRAILAGAIAASLTLSGCNKDSEPKSVALDAEAPAQTGIHPTALDPALTPPAPEATTAAAPNPEPPVRSAVPPIPMPEVPPTIIAAADTQPHLPKPEEPKIPPVDSQRIADLEALTTAQREEIEQLKVGQIETRSLIESLRAELQQAIERMAKPRSAAASHESDAAAAGPITPSNTTSGTSLSRRRGVHDSPPPPFSVESVDTWGNEKRVVVRTPNGRLDLKPGEGYAGWIVQPDSDANLASFRDPKGRETHIAVTWK